ncbi:MAG: hypothetical protein QOK30_525 [Nocardioidaceae bacterium]|nr:hypothetical protein [Nocardioidaceae bacterium]
MQRTKLEAAAANYTYLRGLFFVPLGVLPIISAMGNSGWGPLRSTWVFVAVVAVMGVACLPINGFYNKHYGTLHASARQQVRAAAALVVAVVVVVAGSMLLRSRVSWSLDLPVNATAVTLSLVVLLSYAAGRVLKVHHLVIWGTVLVAGAIPVWNGADPSNIGLAIVGVAMMVNGVFDHLLFVRTFGAPTDLDREGDNARA